MSIERRGAASVITHAAAVDQLTRLRDVTTDTPAFRDALGRLGRTCGEIVVQHYLETESVTVETPLATTTGHRIPDEDVVVVSVLRAVIPFVQGVMEAAPRARQSVISASRNEGAGPRPDGSFPIDVEYVKLPALRPADTVVVADPMLATGSTMTAVLDALHDRGRTPNQVITLAAVSAPAGIERVAAAHPGVEILTVAVDDRLDENGYIVPGLGDAGDRAFGTTDGD